MEEDLGPNAPEDVIRELVRAAPNDLKDDFPLETGTSLSATLVSLDSCPRKKIVRDVFSSATPRFVFL